MIDDDANFDLRYLQGDGFCPDGLDPWIRPRNLFEQRLAENLRPGLALMIDLDTLVRVMGGAAACAPGRAVTVDVTLGKGLLRAVVVSRDNELPPIFADTAGNLISALKWYEAKRVGSILVAVRSPGFFWFPRSVSAGTR